MSDEEYSAGNDSYEPTADELEEAEKPRRSLWGLIAIIAVVVVVIVVLMMLRDCRGTSAYSPDESGKSIEAVKDYEPVEGAISLWVKSGTDVDDVLSTAGVAATGRIDMGEGRWVVDVPRGTEGNCVKALKDAKGVHDAGRVYER